MKGYRPSHFAEEEDSESAQILSDPRRARQIVVYAERVRNGLPLFDDPKDVPVRHLRSHRGAAHAG